MIQATDPQEADWLRQARRLALRALERLGTVRMEDVGVPRGRVPELLVAIDRIGQLLTEFDAESEPRRPEDTQ